MQLNQKTIFLNVKTNTDAIAQYGYSRIYISKLESKEEIINSLLKQYFKYGVHSEFMQLHDGMNSIGSQVSV